MKTRQAGYLERDGQMKRSDGSGRSAKSKIEPGEGIVLVSAPDLVGTEGTLNDQLKARDPIDKGQLHDLVLAITAKSCLADLSVFARGNGGVLVMHDQIVQKELGRNAEGKDQQHYPA